MELFDFISPVYEEFNEYSLSLDENCIGKQIKIYKPNALIDNFNLAIIGYLESEDDYSSSNIRHYLYSLMYILPNHCNIIDLGNIKKGKSNQDTLFAFTETVKVLMSKNIIPVIIGGNKNFNYGLYQSFKKLEKTINMVHIDKSISLNLFEESITDSNFLTSIIKDTPNYLFNLSLIGYQTYFTNPKHLELLNSLNFDCVRLGDLQLNSLEAEALIRSADLFSFSVDSIRQSEFPALKECSPNGLYADYSCQLSWYAGMSDKCSLFGIFDYNCEKDIRNQSALLIAQMIWHFIDGFCKRKDDFPNESSKDYLTYFVNIDEKYSIKFFKSKLTDRWWIEVPYPADKKLKYERHHFVPCTYQDYLTASNNEIPNKWWKTYKKIV